MGNSIEFCGGTHLSNTKDAQAFVITGIIIYIYCMRENISKLISICFLCIGIGIIFKNVQKKYYICMFYIMFYAIFIFVI